MKKLALLGKNIAHSKSKDMYEDLLQQEVEYTLFDFENDSSIPSLKDLFQNIEGLSITSPYKKHFLSEVIIDEDIRSLGAINCIKKVDSAYYATNTDFLALLDLLEQYKTKDIVLLGSGAMANISKLAFKKLGLSYKQYSRKENGDISKLDFSDRKNVLLINSCSREFLFKGMLSKDSIFWDYNYSSTDQEISIKNDGISYVDGLSLLKLQAKYALKFWDL